MGLKLIIYGITWFFVKYSVFAKGWDTGTISIVSVAIMFAGLILIELGKSLLMNGKQGVLYAIVMIGGGLYWISGELFGIKWLLDFGSTGNTVFSIVSISILGTMILKMWRMILTREEE